MIGSLHPSPRWATARPQARTRRTTRTADGLLCLLLFVYLLTLVCEGPLRWGLAMAGAGDLLYLRDAIPVGSLSFLLLRCTLLDERIDLPVLTAIAVLLLHATIAVLLGVQLFAIAFGLKILMFIPYGMAMWPLVRDRLRAAAVAVGVLFVLSLAGIFANALVDRFPWESFAYDTAFGPMTTTREWWTNGGVSRLPGFARTSFQAASILGITGFLVMLASRPAWLRWVVAAATLTAILYTTTKGMMLAFALPAGWLLSGRLSGIATGRALVYATALIALALPIAVVGLGLGYGTTSMLPGIALSTWDRFSSMWPSAFQLLLPGPMALLGTGIGDIGTPQLYGRAPQNFNSADSMAVYLMVQFGLLGLLYYAVPAVAMRRILRFASPALQFAAVGLVLMLYADGGWNNMLEDPFCSVLLGLVLGLAWEDAGRVSGNPPSTKGTR